MDGPDISSTPNPNTQTNLQTFNAPPTTTPPATGQVEYDQNASTISPTDRQLLEELFLAMQFPGLFPPNMANNDLAEIVASGNTQAIAGASGNSSITLLSMSYEKAKHDIISSIWESFAKSVEEMEKLSKEAYIKKWVLEVAKDGPKSGTEYYAYLLALSAANRAEELSKEGDSGQSAFAVQFKSSFDQWFNPSASNSNANGVTPVTGNVTLAEGAVDPNFKVGALASNLDIMGQAVALVGALGVSQLSVSPLADALVAVGPNTALPVDTQAAGALIAALLYSGAKNKADVDTIQEAAAKGQPPQDMDFALNFAKNVLAIVSQNLEGETTASKDQPGQHQMIRLMLSVMALNLVYRAGYGGMEGSKEFTALLEEGGTKDLDPAIKPTIERLLTQIKNFLPTDEPARSQMIASLSEYIDSKDSTESMLSTSRMFAASLNARPDIFSGRLGATSA